jgi:hypothetical protein
MIPSYFIIISPILSSIGMFLYIRDMTLGTTKPNRVSFFLWAFAPIVGALISFSQGAGWSALPVFFAGLGPVLVLVASFIVKQGYWKLGILDYICGALALTTFVIWLVAKDPALALAFAIATDLLAYIPTMVKVHTNPETETSWAYILPTFGNIIGLLILKEWQFTHYGFSLYLICANILCVCLIYRKKCNLF